MSRTITTSPAMMTMATTITAITMTRWPLRT
jgi:hypothetical protein